MIEHDDARLQLADLVVPGLADPMRASGLKAHVAVCAQCQTELAELRRLDELVRVAGPLPQPSATLEARIREITAPVGVQRRFRSDLQVAWQSVRTWRLVAAGTALAAIGAGIVALTGAGASGFDVRQTKAVTVAASWRRVAGEVQLGSADGRTAIRVDLRGLPVGSGRYYELWIAKSPKERISLGPVEPDATGHLVATIRLPALEAGYRGVWLTAEADDANPAWSDDWIFRARFA